jgi:hypothetical protein
VVLKETRGAPSWSPDSGDTGHWVDQAPTDHGSHRRRGSGVIEFAFDTLEHVHKDQLLYSALHGTAMRYAAERRNLDEAIEELRQIADGRNDILAEAAGITAGSWYASPATHVGYELIGAGMLIVAGDGRGLPFDFDELERWTRVGYERGMRSRKGER